MLDLDAGIHFDEIELAVLEQKFDGADAEIFHVLHRLGAGRPDFGAGGGGEDRRGTFLPDFLVTPLQRTVALAEMDRAATAVAQHLDFDVARLLQVFLQIDRGIAERGLGLVGCGRQRHHQIVGRLRDLHAAPAAPGGSLYQHGKADRLRNRHRVVVGSDTAVRARHHGNAEPLRGFLGFDLVAHQTDVLGLRADEMQVMLGEDFDEAGILGQEAVAGMHRIGAGDLARREQRGDVEIAVL